LISKGILERMLELMATKKAENKGGNGFAVIETGGKQYRVAEGDVISVEKMGDTETGKKVKFENVLLKSAGDDLSIGFPMVEKASVEGEVVEEGKGKKTLVMKYKAKSNYFKKYGHRQPYQKVKITKI
jgi:large subunit ribosomal protein L21